MVEIHSKQSPASSCWPSLWPNGCAVLLGGVVMLFWFWVAYVVCAAITYVFVVRSFLRSAVKAKRTMIKKEALGTDTQYYRDWYDGELRCLVFVSPMIAAVWPFLVFVLAVENLVDVSSRLLDKAVTAAMKDSPNE